MRGSGGQAWLSCALVLLAASAGAQEAVPPSRFDPERSALGFEVRTRFGQHLDGDFPHYEGRVEELPDGRRRVHIRVATTEARIPDRPRYTAWMRGSSFFDAERHPWMEFVSEPYPAGLLHEGGTLEGTLTLRGASHRERLQVAPASCERPGRDCDILVRGDIERSHYGMREWQVALADAVRLTVRVRLLETAP
ncbi:YceI family protein [Pseudoxanthomonas koreensis]|uniref:YceI family protein n=1 Tax=Pseudoxanthomonas koreensis TaxID=266061 RepID=UPI0013909F97|nr:YceI family protein [Pseudoxanthomonas koreensis]KAF1693588.1 hypothetical protein CSC64_05500 [Pseudoxanthomonas koreensis]